LATFQNVNNKTFFTFSYHVLQENEIDQNLKITLYRIVQEQLNNIIKHADAADVHVSISSDNRHLNLKIEDNGKGFDTHESRRGIGINNIISRAEAYHGVVALDSQPGDGCTLTVSFPLGHAPSKRTAFFAKIAANYF
jgi:signal transduction histidine kinase